MKAKIITLGCKVNQYESEAMLEALLAGGFQEAASGEEADVVVVNSCTVTATSDQKVRQTLRRARKENPGAVTVLTGCMPRRGAGQCPPGRPAPPGDGVPVLQAAHCGHRPSREGGEV